LYKVNQVGKQFMEKGS